MVVGHGRLGRGRVHMLRLCGDHHDPAVSTDLDGCAVSFLQLLHASYIELQIVHFRKSTAPRSTRTPSNSTRP